METLREGSPEWVAEMLKSNPTKEFEVAKINTDMVTDWLIKYEPELEFKVRVTKKAAYFRNNLDGESIDGICDQLNVLEEHLTKASGAFDLVLAEKSALEDQVAELSARLRELEKQAA